MPRKPSSSSRPARLPKPIRAAREFHRLAKSEPRIDKAFAPFLGQAYNLKAVGDYETGPDSNIPLERSAAALETATRFVACIAELLATS